MDERSLAEQFGQQRSRLRAVAYRILGSLNEADDAVQETSLRLRRVDADEIENLERWLTTVVTRICLNLLRGRRTHPEALLEVHVPDPVIDHPDAVQPEHEALLADAVGMALMTVLQALPPPERVALVLHDSFAVPFEEIAAILAKTPAATRQLASRARRTLRDTPTTPEPNLARQRAGRHRVATSRLARGAAAVANSALMFSRPTATVRPALVNGAAGVVIEEAGRAIAVMAFTVAGGRVVAIDGLNDLDRMRQLDLSAPVELRRADVRSDAAHRRPIARSRWPSVNGATSYPSSASASGRPAVASSAWYRKR